MQRRALKDSSTNAEHPQTKTVGIQVNSNDIDTCMCTSISETDLIKQHASQRKEADTCMPYIDEETDSSDYRDEYMMDSDDTEGLKRYEGGVSLTYLHGVFYMPPE